MQSRFALPEARRVNGAAMMCSAQHDGRRKSGEGETDECCRCALQQRRGGVVIDLSFSCGSRLTFLIEILSFQKKFTFIINSHSHNLKMR